MVLACVAIAGSAMAAPPRGSDAPLIKLGDLTGNMVASTDFAPRPLVLIFGEMTHEGTKQACADVLEVIAQPAVAAAQPVAIMLVAQDEKAPKLQEEAAAGKFPSIILHDVARDAFGSYHILVNPTIVVVDGKGKVTFSMPGFRPRFKEILGEAILTAAGKEAPAQFEQTIDPAAQEPTKEGSRAERLVHLGNELTKHNEFAKAEVNFTEALKSEPGNIGAKIGLAELMMRQNRISDAEPFLRSVLAAKPDHTEAMLCMADVQFRKGGDEGVRAEKCVNSVIEKEPANVKARFLFGQILEKKGDVAGALAEYKKSAELLMNR
jgi:cytochrome c-type biogenesis protein CcmH/NrfG